MLSHFKDFWGQETDIMGQFLDPETDIMGKNFFSYFHIFQSNIFVTKFQNQNYSTPASEASWGSIILLGKAKGVRTSY